MPGRGQYWKVGGINDLHIVEADLDTALQNKVNAGGGGGLWEKVADVTAGASNDTITLTPSPSIDMHDVALVKIIISGGPSTDDSVVYRINGITTGYDQIGGRVEAGSPIEKVEQSSTFAWKSDTPWDAGNDNFATIEFSNIGQGNLNGRLEENSRRDGWASIAISQTSIQTLTNFQIIGGDIGGTNFDPLTRAVMYVLNLS